MRLALAVLLALACTAPSAREVYKWVDRDGNVHYGDKPKHDAEPVDATPPGGDTPVLTPEQQQAAAARAAECEVKKKQLDTYRKASAIKETDALGREREYTKEEREQLVALTEKRMHELCTPLQAAAADDSGALPESAPAEAPAMDSAPAP